MLGALLPRHLAEPPGLEVVERLGDLRLAVHHERAIADDRLIDWFAAEQQQAHVFQGLHLYVLTIALEQHQAGRPGLTLAGVRMALRFMEPSLLDRYVDGLRLAGLPE